MADKKKEKEAEKGKEPEKAKEEVKKTINLAKEQKKLTEEFAKTKKKVDEFKESVKSLKKPTAELMEGLESDIIKLTTDLEQLAIMEKSALDILSTQQQEQSKAALAETTAAKASLEKQKELVKVYRDKYTTIQTEGLKSKELIEKEYGENVKLSEKMTDLAKQKEYLSELEAKRIRDLETIDKEAKASMLANSIEYHSAVELQSKESMDSMLKLIETNKMHVKGAWNGVVDVGGTKEMMATAKQARDNYLKEVKEFGVQMAAEYDKQLSVEGLSLEEKKRLEEEKMAFVKSNNALLEAETKRSEEAITAIEEKNKNLRLDQWKQYAAKTSGVLGKVNEQSKMVTDMLSNGLKSIASACDEQIKDITTKIEEADKQMADAVAEHRKSIGMSEEEAVAKKTMLAAEKESLKKVEQEEQEATITGAAAISAERQLELDELKKTSGEKIQNLSKELEGETNIEKEHSDKKKKLEDEKKKLEKKKRAAEKMQAKLDMGQKIVTATSDVAAGVTKALGSAPPPFSYVLAAAVGAMGAVQIGIMSRQFSKLFEDGGLLNGKRHSDGGMRIEGTNIEVEGGEYVVNRESTSKNIGLVKYINSQRKRLSANDIDAYFGTSSSWRTYEPPMRRQMEAGGSIPPIINNMNSENEALVRAIQGLKLEPKVSVTDILHVQNQMVKVDEWAGM